MSLAAPGNWQLIAGDTRGTISTRGTCAARTQTRKKSCPHTNTQKRLDMRLGRGSTTTATTLRVLEPTTLHVPIGTLPLAHQGASLQGELAHISGSSTSCAGALERTSALRTRAHESYTTQRAAAVRPVHTACNPGETPSPAGCLPPLNG